MLPLNSRFMYLNACLPFPLESLTGNSNIMSKMVLLIFLLIFSCTVPKRERSPPPNQSIDYARNPEAFLISHLSWPTTILPESQSASKTYPPLPFKSSATFSSPIYSLGWGYCSSPLAGLLQTSIFALLTLTHSLQNRQGKQKIHKNLKAQVT